MTSIEIIDIKQFMKHILVGSIFDDFYAYKLDISSFCNFSVHGSINTDYYTIEEKEGLYGRENAFWKEIKPFVFQMMKGNKTPLSFLIILKPSELLYTNILNLCGGKVREEEIAGIFLNIRYLNKALSLVTGTSMKSFTLDRTVEEAWDEEIKKFLKGNNIL